MARLHGPLRIEEVFVPTTGHTLLVGGRVVWRLLDSLAWHAKPDDLDPLIVVPAGFETDLASTPWLLRWLIPPSGPRQRAAVLHDWLYTEQPAGWTRAQADRLFRQAMAAAGVSWPLRWLIWTGVRIGGLRGWRDLRDVLGERGE